MDTAVSLDPKLERHTSRNSALHPSTRLPKQRTFVRHTRARHRDAARKRHRRAALPLLSITIPQYVEPGPGSHRGGARRLHAVADGRQARLARARRDLSVCAFQVSNITCYISNLSFVVRVSEFSGCF